MEKKKQEITQEFLPFEEEQPKDDSPPSPPEADEAFHPLRDDHGPLKELMDSNFLLYASYVICDRAIPALEDGLKPVQRRILHALWEKDDGRFIKVANVVGHTMQYHPHGDASIADALVTLVNKGYLIEGQGNFGNIYTGDRAAAPRYIECRLTPLARNEIFNKDLTEWIPSYDGRNKEPVTLPAKLPLMLMLGADGIAVGLSTSILPHNFIELLEAEIEILREKKSAPAQLDLLPDFPTGGLMDVSEYDRGRGRVKVRALIEPRKNNRLVITELPFGVTTESLIASIEDAVKKRKVPVRAINDYTAEKVEIELVLSPGASQEKAMQALYAFTRCEVAVSSRIICLRDKRPVEMTVDEVLRENVRRLLEILEGELTLRRQRLLDEFHNKTLVQIFVENRIYKRIEQCKSYEAVLAAIRKGLEPFKDRLRREITDADLEMLLGVRIRRISLFDINKNREEIEKILAELAEVEKHLKSLKRYAVRYLQRLIKEYREQYPRRTRVAEFGRIAVRDLTATELQIRRNDDGYVGSAVKGEVLLECSSLDKLVFFRDDGSYKVMPPPEKFFADRNLLRVDIFDRDREYTAVYTVSGVTFLKRFKLGGAIMNRDYSLIPAGKGKVRLLVEGTPEAIYVKYQKAKGQRIRQQKFDPKDVAVKGVKARGKRMTIKKIQYIDTQPGRWWDSSEGDAAPRGVLL